jgi:hypothetical protein
MFNSEFMTYLRLGFGHIVTAGAMDHILFLIALAAIYRLRDWRAALVVVSAFTIGHATTLLVSVLAPGTLPSSALVEFLIPLTIVATGIENIVVPRREQRNWGRVARPLLAGVFGLVHGAGFADYLRELFVESVAVPLAGFNVGIELGQVVVLSAAVLIFAAIDRLFSSVVTAARGKPDLSLRLRVMSVSAVVVVAGSIWAFERAPW